MSAILDAALEAVDAGLSVVRVREDGSKQPVGTWKRQQHVRHEPSVLKRLFANGSTGLGVVCGAISRNLELLEFDDAETYDRYKALAAEVGLGDLVERIESGYLERSPSGGVHWLMRCPEISGSLKLASRPKLAEEKQHENDNTQVLIETRGEAGYVITAPSNGGVHPSGRPYVLVRGRFGSICEITPEERLALWDLARTFDLMPFTRALEPAPKPSTTDGNRPGDAFNRQATWTEILEPRGWKLVYEHGGTAYWRRPGKDLGISATTNYADSDLLYVFTTSTSLEGGRAYSKFGVYTALHHNNDFRAAAAELARQGFGEPRTSVGPLGISAREMLSAGTVCIRPAESAIAFTTARSLGDETTGQALANGVTAARLRPLRADELLPAERKPIPWLIEAPADVDGHTAGGLLAEGDTLIIGADSGQGKTWLIQDLTLALLTGTPFVGHFPVSRPCRVMLVDEESSLWLLQNRWPLMLLGRGMSHPDFEAEAWPRLRIFLDQGFSFDDDRALAALTEQALAFRPDLVLFDTLARVHRRSENDNSAMAALFAERIRPFTRAVGCGVGFNHHTRKPSRLESSDAGSMLRGASDLKSQADQFWFLRGRAGDSRVTFEHAKCRSAPPLPSFVIAREHTENGGVVLRYDGGPEHLKTSALDQAMEVILRYLIDNGEMPRTAVLEFCRTRAIGRRNASTALTALVDEDQVVKRRAGRETLYGPMPPRE